MIVLGFALRSKHRIFGASSEAMLTAEKETDVELSTQEFPARQNRTSWSLRSLEDGGSLGQV